MQYFVVFFPSVGGLKVHVLVCIKTPKQSILDTFSSVSESYPFDMTAQ